MQQQHWSKLTVGVSAAALLSLVACGEVKRPDGGVGLLPVGAVAPDVQGTDASGKTVHLSDARGGRAVVYFYPKDGTPGCTTEACAFRDSWKRYEAAHVLLFGVSSDSAESHVDFAKHHSLPFPLVADNDGTIAKAYGVKSTLGLDSRVSFLVGPDGKIEKVWPRVDPAVHADEVLAAATAKP
jgi:peroxiredoxin Q/BCP